MKLSDIKNMGEQYLEEFVHLNSSVSIFDSVLIGLHIRAFTEKTSELMRKKLVDRITEMEAETPPTRQ